MQRINYNEKLSRNQVDRRIASIIDDFEVWVPLLKIDSLQIIDCSRGRFAADDVREENNSAIV